MYPRTCPWIRPSDGPLTTKTTSVLLTRMRGHPPPHSMEVFSSHCVKSLCWPGAIAQLPLTLSRKPCGKLTGMLRKHRLKHQVGADGAPTREDFFGPTRLGEAGAGSPVVLPVGSNLRTDRAFIRHTLIVKAMNRGRLAALKASLGKVIQIKQNRFPNRIPQGPQSVSCRSSPLLLLCCQFPDTTFANPAD